MSFNIKPGKSSRIKNSDRGFTLLEIIVVIIILGILISTGLPHYFKSIEFARSTEALGSLQALRMAAERCATGISAIDYSGCADFDALAIDDPASPVWTYGISDNTASTLTLTATRTALENGNTSDTIALVGTGLDGANPVWDRQGGGNFSKVR